MDPNTYRAESHDRWSRSARGWGARRRELQAIAQGVSLRMLDLLAPQPGQTVLELAAGPGDTGLLAAELVGPTGHVILSDFSEPMVDIARERAAEVDAKNIEFRVIDAESIDLEAAAVDGVLCRWGYMLMADPAAALQETRRVLRPGRRVVFAAWDGPDLNRWATIPFMELVKRGLVPPPDPAGPGMFSFSAEGKIEALLADAGFGDVSVEGVDLEFAYDSMDHVWAAGRDLNRPFDDAVAAMAVEEAADMRATIAEAFAPDTAPDGSITVSGRTLVASASA